MKKKDPKVGTGKKPKGSGRRLYTDENPKDTVPIKFATVADAQATARKVKRINKPYAGRFKSLLWWSSELKSQGSQDKPQSQKEQKKNSEQNTKRKRGRPRKK